MIRQFRAYAATIVIVFTSAWFCHSSAVAAVHNFNAGIQAVIDSVNAELEQVFGAVSGIGLKSDVALTDHINMNGSTPVIVRLPDSDLSRIFFPDRQSSCRPKITGDLQGTLLNGMIAPLAGEKADLHNTRLSRILSIADQISSSEPGALLNSPNLIDTADDATDSRALQGSSSSGLENNTSIIAVRILTLIDNEARRGSDLDLYLGFNSRLDENYEQTSSLPQAGQTFYGGLTWTF